MALQRLSPITRWHHNGWMIKSTLAIIHLDSGKNPVRLVSALQSLLSSNLTYPAVVISSVHLSCARHVRAYVICGFACAGHMPAYVTTYAGICLCMPLCVFMLSACVQNTYARHMRVVQTTFTTALLGTCHMRSAYAAYVICAPD